MNNITFNKIMIYKNIFIKTALVIAVLFSVFSVAPKHEASALTSAINSAAQKMSSGGSSCSGSSCSGSSSSSTSSRTSSGSGLTATINSTVQDMNNSCSGKSCPGSTLATSTSTSTSSAPSAPSCPFTSGSNRYVVNFGARLRADQSLSNSRQLVSTNMPAGRYYIRIMTWDAHSHHGGQNQNNEQVVLTLRDSSGVNMHTTNRSQDIPSNQDSVISVISTNADVPDSIRQILAFHPEYPSSNPQSLTPICAEFTRIQGPTQQQLDVSCSVSNTNITAGQSTTFTANATGGTGSYTYRWFNDVDDTRRTFSRVFNHPGNYSASVEVTDAAGNRRTASCPVVVVQDSVSSLDVQCNISRSTIDVGERVDISADIFGGRSPYYVDWSRDARLIDGFNLTRQNQSIRIYEEGTYRLRVDVEDRNGNMASDTCTIIVRDDVSPNINVISTTTTTPPDGDLAGLTSVYLNQVPYTGSENVLKVAGFISLILVWSSAVAFYLLNDRKKKIVSNKILAFKEANRRSRLGFEKIQN